MDKEKNYMNEEIDDSVGTMEDVNAVMKKYDRESNVRIYEGVPRIFVRALMVGFAFYALVDAVFLTTLPERRYSILARHAPSISDKHKPHFALLR